MNCLIPKNASIADTEKQTTMTPDELINGVDTLLSLPDVVIRANELLESDQADLDAIGEVISHDPALSAQLLKLVNSAFYSFPGEVDTITRAITLVGTKELHSLIMASSATSIFNAIAPELIDMNSFWHRSVFAGLIAKRLAVMSDISRTGEVQFLSGLFHDVGRLVIFNQLPQQASLILSKTQSAHCATHEMEELLLGFNSAQVGACLLQSWRLPKVIWEPILHQHIPGKATEFRAQAELLNLAIRLTNTLEPELKEGEALNLDRIKPTTLGGIHLEQNDLGLVALDANMETFEVLNIINPLATAIY